MTEIVVDVLINIVVGVLIIDKRRTSDIGKQESEET
jgi:hypothetical protein